MLRYTIKLFPIFSQENFHSEVCLLHFRFIVSSDNLYYTTILGKSDRTEMDAFPFFFSFLISFFSAWFQFFLDSFAADFNF